MNFFLSSSIIALKALQYRRGCGALWMGHSSVLSVLAVVSSEMFVLCTVTDCVLLKLVFRSSLTDVVRDVVLKLGSLRAFASLLMNSTKKWNGGNETLCCSLYFDPVDIHLSWRLNGSLSTIGPTPLAVSK